MIRRTLRPYLAPPLSFRYPLCRSYHLCVLYWNPVLYERLFLIFTSKQTFDVKRNASERDCPPSRRATNGSCFRLPKWVSPSLVPAIPCGLTDGVDTHLRRYNHYADAKHA